ncbi:hypothetical protein C2G38_2037458 [Gigaspora rosea]|uniref:Uncharacterized protein n=1 Tax=Gigaspora rosea TaxID=44941 RepID=A0A397VCK6_9GLOM|nr:hypothetical protein C2G38_2037458 [Gigaspora rosea]
MSEKIALRNHTTYDLDDESQKLLIEIRTTMKTSNPTESIYDDLQDVLGAIKDLQKKVEDSSKTIKLPENKKQEISESLIQQITYSFGAQRNSQLEEATKAYINKLDDYEGIENPYTHFFDDTSKNAFQTVTTNAYNKGKEYWAEFWGHYLSRRVYQEKLALRK